MKLGQYGEFINEINEARMVILLHVFASFQSIWWMWNENAWILNLQIVLGTLMWHKLDDSCAHRDVFDLGLKTAIQIWILSQTFEDTSYGIFDKEFNFQNYCHLPKLNTSNLLHFIKIGGSNTTWTPLEHHNMSKGTKTPHQTMSFERLEE